LIGVEEVAGVGSLHQTGFTLAVKVFLCGQNCTAKQYNIFLVATTNRKEKLIPWLFFRAAKENVYFLGCFHAPPRKKLVSVAICLYRQVKEELTWPFS
jgi:hypothetical protein